MARTAHHMHRAVEGDEDATARILLTGVRGVGKSASLTALAASARHSNHIVLFVPQTNRLRTLGYYIIPSPDTPGLFDLPRLAIELNEQLLVNHEDLLADMMITDDIALPQLLIELLVSPPHTEEASDDQLKSPTSKSSYSCTDLLRVGVSNEEYSSLIYSRVMRHLQQQTNVPFHIIVDDYNTLYEKGKFYHEDYDYEVQESIPNHKITLFRPLLGVGFSDVFDDGEQQEENTEIASNPKGSFVCATSERRAVPNADTKRLIQAATKNDNDIVVEVPRYSPIEVKHILANFECTGIGLLRDEDDNTINDPKEVAYHQMVSGMRGHKLLDSVFSY